jgi:uncharacterized protein YkwD
MLWALIASFALLLGNEAPGIAQPEQQNSVQNQRPSPKLTPAALPTQDEDAAAETQLLALANQSRQRAGAPPLREDRTLTEAALDHARLMVASGTLSHQYEGETALLQRLAGAGPIRLDRAGENVAYHESAESAHDALMHSPPHRQNLLDPGFNAAGIAAIWSNGRLYVVEDFAHEFQSYSAQQMRHLVVAAIDEIRNQAGASPLKQVSASGLDSAVCVLSRQSRFSARRLNVAYPSRSVITYTQSRPEVLPPAAIRMLRDSAVRQFAVGTCYAADANFPSGTYWIAILLY